ncbi:MAG: hypothetical protein IAE82_06935 [Opitutaceae bacterium]|nr:hypothetical protein [Opitutaceae bacterium]
MSTPENFWGDIPKKPNIRTPLSILKEQADLLGKLTDGALAGRVETHSNGEMLNHSLGVVVSALNNYEIEVLGVRHGLRLYPTEIQDRIGDGKWRDAEDQESYIQVLRSILGSKDVRNVVEALLAQAQANERPPSKDDIPF